MSLLSKIVNSFGAKTKVESKMDQLGNLSKYFSLTKQYCELYDDYNHRGVEKTLDEKDKEFPDDEAWRYDHYFTVGADALRIIVKSLLGCLHEPPKTILDFPSGSGRVTRHLKSFFPGARIVACDLYDDHVNFCTNQLGVDGMISNEFFGRIKFDCQFDLIFCGSLLTHLPQERFHRHNPEIER